MTFHHDDSETLSAGFTYTVEDDMGTTSNVATVILSVAAVNETTTTGRADSRGRTLLVWRV